MNGTTTSRLSASAMPPALPSQRADQAITTPCTMNIFMMLRGDAPSVRRIAMSACLS